MRSSTNRALLLAACAALDALARDIGRLLPSEEEGANPAEAGADGSRGHGDDADQRLKQHASGSRVEVGMGGKRDRKACEGEKCLVHEGTAGQVIGGCGANPQNCNHSVTANKG